LSRDFDACLHNLSAAKSASGSTGRKSAPNSVPRLSETGNTQGADVIEQRLRLDYGAKTYPKIEFRMDVASGSRPIGRFAPYIISHFCFAHGYKSSVGRFNK
jgi:hypothetical protein